MKKALVNNSTDTVENILLVNEDYEAPSGYRLEESPLVIGATLVSGEWQTPDPKEELRKITFIPREEFALKSFEQEWITAQEAEEWASGVTIPTFALTAINAQYTGAEALRIRILVRTGPRVFREDAVVLLLKEVLEVSDETLDEVFGI